MQFYVSFYLKPKLIYCISVFFVTVNYASSGKNQLFVYILYSLNKITDVCSFRPDVVFILQYTTVVLPKTHVLKTRCEFPETNFSNWCHHHHRRRCRRHHDQNQNHIIITVDVVVVIIVITIITVHLSTSGYQQTLLVTFFSSELRLPFPSNTFLFSS